MKPLQEMMQFWKNTCEQQGRCNECPLKHHCNWATKDYLEKNNKRWN